MNAVAAATTLAAACLIASPLQAGHLNIVLEASLDGRQEVATGATNRRIVGDPNGRGEAYVFGIDANTTTLCYVVQVDRIGELSLPPGNGRQAHIHRGSAGENGPAVVTLAWPQDGRSADCIAQDRILPNGNPAFSRDPNTGEPLATVFEILMNPEQFYVNVHNAEYPGGAVRGQLEDTLSP
ncbi:MAG: CHRD domain-containing protein [Proteobacteria bacterium]|nr:CHRD domain-containing protein [Pseudomonadota bacterium]